MRILKFRPDEGTPTTVKRVRFRVSPSVAFPMLCKAQHLPVPTAEYRFHPTRRWRFDWAWPDQKVALEIDGGIWTRGAHGRGAGIARDQEKTNHAAALGWRVLRVEPKNYAVPSTFALLKSALRWSTEEVPG